MQKVADEELSVMAGEILKAGGRISTLIGEMLDLSKMEEGKAKIDYSPLYIREILDQAVKEAEADAAVKNVRLKLIVDDDIGTVTVDRMLLMRAVGNLVGNAVKYNRWGGAVTVRAENYGGDRVMIEVSDTGTGIPPEDLPHIFDKYYRSPKTGGIVGTGLGLAIVKAVAEAHGGSVGARSTESQGSTFTIILPKNPADSDRKAA